MIYKDGATRPALYQKVPGSKKGDGEDEEI